MLYRPDKRFHFVLTEATLRYRLCAPEVMLGRLDRLISFAALPNVRLGIVGFDTAYVVAPAHGFWLLDSDRVMVETVSRRSRWRELVVIPAGAAVAGSVRRRGWERRQMTSASWSAWTGAVMTRPSTWKRSWTILLASTSYGDGMTISLAVSPQRLSRP